MVDRTPLQVEVDKQDADEAEELEDEAADTKVGPEVAGSTLRPDADFPVPSSTSGRSVSLIVGPARLQDLQSQPKRPAAFNLEILSDVERQGTRLRRTTMTAQQPSGRNYARFLLDDIINAEMHRLDRHKDNKRIVLEKLKEDLSAGRVERVKEALGYKAEVKNHLANVYYRLLWMRFPGASLACALLCFALSSGLFVDFLLTAIQVSEQGTTDPGVRFVSLCVYILPYLTILAALFIHQGLQLFFESIDTIPLTQTRARVLTACGVRPDAPPSKSLCYLVDTSIMMWLEVIPLLWMICMHANHGVPLWTGYVSGLLVACSIASIWSSITALVVAYRCWGALFACKSTDSQEWPLVSMEVMRETMQSAGIKPTIIPWRGMGGRHQAFALSMTPSEAEHRLAFFKSREMLKTELFVKAKTRSSAERQGSLWRRCVDLTLANHTAIIITASGVIWWLVCFISFGVQATPIYAKTLIVALFGCVMALSLGVLRFLKGSGGGTSFLSATFLLLILQAGLIWQNSIEGVKKKDPPLMVAPTGSSKYGLPTSWVNDPAVTPYPVCRLIWGGPTVSLTVMDMAALTWISYEEHCDRIVEELQKSFSGTGLNPVLEFCSPYTALPRSVVVYFRGPHHGKGTRVIVVKGSSHKLDYYADMAIWGSVHLMQLFSTYIEPLVGLLPDTMIQKMVKWQNVGSFFKPVDELCANVSNLEFFLNKSKGELPPTDGPPVMTGHSLGGAIAAVVGSRSSLDVLAFSAPGTLFTGRIFKTTSQRSQKYVNVMPDNDMVPRADMHIGVVQRILCRDKTGAEASAVDCHRLGKTSCELWRVCGDAPYHRNFTLCPNYLSAKQIGKELPDYDGWAS